MSGPLLDRRRFLGSTAATAALLALHDLPAWAAQGVTTPAVLDRRAAAHPDAGAPVGRAARRHEGVLRQAARSGRPFGPARSLHLRRGRNQNDLRRRAPSTGGERPVLPLRLQHPREQDSGGARMAESSHPAAARSRKPPRAGVSGRGRRFRVTGTRTRFSSSIRPATWSSTSRVTT